MPYAMEIIYHAALRGEEGEGQKYIFLPRGWAPGL